MPSNSSATGPGGYTRPGTSVRARLPSRSSQTVRRSLLRRRKSILAAPVGQPQFGEKTLSACGPYSGTSSVFTPSLTANAPAVAPRRATQKAVESSRATPGSSTSRPRVLRRLVGGDPADEELAPRPGEERSHE